MKKLFVLALVTLYSLSSFAFNVNLEVDTSHYCKSSAKNIENIKNFVDMLKKLNLSEFDRKFYACISYGGTDGYPKTLGKEFNNLSELSRELENRENSIKSNTTLNCYFTDSYTKYESKTLNFISQQFEPRRFSWSSLTFYSLLAFAGWCFYKGYTTNQ